MFSLNLHRKEKKSIFKTDKNWENDSQTFKICQCTVYFVLNKIETFSFSIKKYFVLSAYINAIINLKTE